MSLREKRLEDYFSSQLFPINIIEENNKKRLALSLSLFKICSNFPKEEMGKMKKIQKSLEQDQVSQLLFGKNWAELSEDKQPEVKKLLNKRASTPTRTSSYVKFIVKSFLKTYDETVRIASFSEEIQDGWVFEKNGVKYDLTINKDKIVLGNYIYFDSTTILDENRLIKKDFLHLIAANLVENYDREKVEKISVCLNKIIDNYNYLYKTQEAVISLNIKEEKEELLSRVAVE